MTADGLKKKLLPMSETMFYILSSLRQERHGYGIMLHVKEITQGRIVLGAGTIYPVSYTHLTLPTTPYV